MNDLEKRFDKMINDLQINLRNDFAIIAHKNIIKYIKQSKFKKITSWNGIKIKKCKNYKYLFLKRLRKQKSIKKLRINV